MANPTPTNSTLRELAEAATPGPWTATTAEWHCDCEKENCTSEDECLDGYWEGCPGVDKIYTLEMGDFYAMNNENAAYVAAVDPQSILALLAERDKLAGEVERLGKCNEDVCEANASLRTQLSEAQHEIVDLTQAVQLAEEDILLMMTERNEAQAERDAAYEGLKQRDLEWLPFSEAPTDGRKLIVGSIAKFTPYKEPKKQGRKGRWQIRDEYGKWRNIDRTVDHFIAGYKPDRKAAQLIQSKEGA